MSEQAQSRNDDTHDGSSDALDLFFDLVFVYAMSQVTALMLADPTVPGVAHGALALAAVWWAWTCFAWLATASSRFRTVEQTLIFLAMAGVVIAADALPNAFGSSALLFGVAYASVRAIHLLLLFLTTRDSAEARGGVRRLTPTLLLGPAAILAAAFVDSPYRELLWLIGAAVDFGGPAIRGVRGFRVPPAFFVDRHGSIIIIALGEAIVRVGAGALEQLQQPAVLLAVVLGILISATLWAAYFGQTTQAQARLTRAHDDERARLARDAYSYLHLPLVGGIVLFALESRWRSPV